jgi:very-short-patch-repair endonuclease
MRLFGATKPKSEDHRRRCVQGLARRWASEEPTDIEKAVQNFLTKLGYEFIREYPIDRYLADFYLPEFKLVIEVDGDYWHSLPGAKEHDAKRDIFFKNLGYEVLRLTGSQILKDEDFCIQENTGLDDQKGLLVDSPSSSYKRPTLGLQALSGPVPGRRSLTYIP